MSIATPETSAISTPLPGTGPVPVPSPIYIDGIPVPLATPPVSPASRMNRAQQFWSSVPRPVTSNIEENLYVSLPHPKTINYLTFDLAHFPQQFSVSWLNSQGQLEPVLWSNGTPMVLTISGSVPLIVNNSAALAAGMNPYHYGAGHWDHFEEIITPVTTTQLVFSGIRAGGAGLPRYTTPVDASGNPSPYPLGIRDLDFGYQILTRADVPYTGRSSTVVTERQPFAVTSDVHGSPMTVSMRENRASDLLAGGTWCCSPQLRSDAVVNLYVDSRTAGGLPQVIDGFRLEPVTSGVRCNVYYAPQPPPPGPVFSSPDTPLTAPAVQAGGTQLPQAGSSGLLFGNTPSWVQVSAQAAGITGTSPWWVAAAFQPQFSSSATGSYMLADSGAFQVYYQAGSIYMTTAGGNPAAVQPASINPLFSGANPVNALITRDQTSSIYAGNSATNIVSWPVNPTAGSKVLLAVAVHSTSAPTSVIDNGTTPATWVLDQSNNAGAHEILIYRADNITLPASGSFQVTVTLGSATSTTIMGQSYLGLASGGPATANNGSGTGTAVTTGSATPAAPATLFFAAFQDNSGLNPETISAPGGGFSNILTYTNGSAAQASAAADLIISGNSAQTCTWTLGDSVGWNAGIAAYSSVPPTNGWSGYFSALTGVSSPVLPAGSPYLTGGYLTPAAASVRLSCIQTVPVKPNVSYTPSMLGYFTGNDIHQQSFQCDWYTAGNTYISSSISFQAIGNQNTWNSYTGQYGQFVAPTNAAYCHFFPNFYNDGVTALNAADSAYVTACQLVPSAVQVNTLGSWTVPFAVNDQLIFTVVYDGQNFWGGLYWQGWQAFFAVPASVLPPISAFSLADSLPSTDTGTQSGAAFSLMYGNYLLTALAIGQQQLNMASGTPDPVLQQFAANPATFVYPPGGAMPQNLAVRFAPQFLLPYGVVTPAQTSSGYNLQGTPASSSVPPAGLSVSGAGTGNATISSVNPWGFVGGITSSYEACTWIPVCRDFTVARGLMEFDPVLASCFKFEFTSLAAEPFDFLDTVPITVQSSQITPVSAPYFRSPPKTATLDNGLVINQNLAPTVTYSDVPQPQTPGPAGAALPRQVIYASTPEGADSMAQLGSLYNFQTFKTASAIPVQASAGVHVYGISQYTTHSRIAYFVALSGITMYRNSYTTQDDAEEYTELFGDQANYSLTSSGFPQLSWLWSAGELHTGSDFLALTGVATATSAIFASDHNVTGVQFATTQSEAIQLLPDPAFAQTGLPSWSPVGDVSQLPIATGINTALGSMVECSRAPTVYSWASLQAGFSSWSVLQSVISTWNTFVVIPAASIYGGLQCSKPQVTTAAGRIYAAVRVFTPVALTQPLALQILDGATGAVLSETDNPVAGGVVTEWFTGYTIGTGDYSQSLNWGQVQTAYSSWNAIGAQYWNQVDLVNYPLGQTITARLIQRGITNDIWYVDNLSMFEESIVWSFSNDGGASWYPAYDIRNNPSGVVKFGTPQQGTGNQLMWRLQGYRGNLTVTSLAIRPWYSVFPHGYPSRPAGVGHGPNVSPLDHYPPIMDDPRWQAWDQPIPQAWYFTYEQILLQGANYVPSSLAPPQTPLPEVVLGSALAISAASQALPPPPEPIFWDDILVDVFTDTYGIAGAGDVYDDNFDDPYASDYIVLTGTVHSGAAAFTQGTVLAMPASPQGVAQPQVSLPVVPLEGANLGYVGGQSVAISDFIHATGQPLGLRRIYMGNSIPSSLATSLAAYDAGVRKVFFDFQPDATNTPAQLDAFLASCVAGGLQAEVSLWSNPNTGFTNPSDFFNICSQYVPIIQNYGYQYVFVLNNTVAASGGLQTWWPGSYCTVNAMSVGLISNGNCPGDAGAPSLRAAASWADFYGVPFGLAEFGADWSKISQHAGSTFLTYVLEFFQARLAAGKPVGDLVYLGTGTYSLPNAPHQWISLYNQISAMLAAAEVG